MIYLASDHRGFELKEKIKEWLKELGYEYEDIGALKYDKDDDYPDFAELAARRVAAEQGSKGILACGSGIGVIVAANKVKGIIAGTMTNPEQTKAAVNDEDINIIGLSADYSSEDNNKQIVKTFVKSEFSGSERHIRRLDKIKKIEEGLTQ
ncbi:MAG: RpiB/LacA/LacB family sugar-phosphate isomerase [Patescibacteria group bacterium]|mgnify:CR=1 FL=1